jgi:hypothetical protein
MYTLTLRWYYTHLLLRILVDEQILRCMFVHKVAENWFRY